MTAARGMRERLETAIYNAEQTCDGAIGAGFCKPDCETAGECLRERRVADAILAVLREPDEGLIEAGAAALYAADEARFCAENPMRLEPKPWHRVRKGSVTWERMTGDAQAAFRAAIDTLREGRG